MRRADLLTELHDAIFWASSYRLLASAAATIDSLLGSAALSSVGLFGIGRSNIPILCTGASNS
jgi:hypothetical protein